MIRFEYKTNNWTHYDSLPRVKMTTYMEKNWNELDIKEIMSSAKYF